MVKSIYTVYTNLLSSLCFLPPQHSAFLCKSALPQTVAGGSGLGRKATSCRLGGLRGLLGGAPGTPPSPWLLQEAGEETCWSGSGAATESPLLEPCSRSARSWRRLQPGRDAGGAAVWTQQQILLLLARDGWMWEPLEVIYIDLYTFYT